MTSRMRDAQGRTLDEFLAAYHPGDYERPSVTVDVAILTSEGEALLIRRGNHPNLGMWALPGGFVDMKETLYEAAARELREETGLAGVPLRSLGLYAEPTRDPRLRVITAAFGAIAPRKSLAFRAGDDAADALLFRWQIEALGKIAIPSASQAAPHALRLPCTAVGEPIGATGDGYALTLEADSIRISARLAISGGVDVLLGGTLRPTDDALAGDHALILFGALRAFGGRAF